VKIVSRGHLVDALVLTQLVEANSKLQLDNALLRRAISEKDELLELASTVITEYNEVLGMETHG